MKLNFDITFSEYEIVKNILVLHLSQDCKIWVFGSRSKNKTRFNSDLDLALQDIKPLPQATLIDLKEDFSESSLPYTVDVVDMNTIAIDFKQIIEKQAIEFPIEKTPTTPKIRFPEFKDSGAWEEKRLGEVVCFLKDGTHGTHENCENSDYYLLSAKNINNGRVTFDDTDRKISYDEFQSIYKNYALEKNDILLTVVGTIGRVALYDGNKKLAFQRSVAFFRLEKDNPYYVYYCFENASFQKQLLKRQVVSAQPGIYLGDLAKIKISLPSLLEQQKIADFLTTVDDKIGLLTKEHKLWQTYKKGMMQRIFSQSLRFTDENGNPYPDWEEKKLGEVGTFFSGGTPLTTNQNFYIGKIPFIKSGEINNEKTEQFISQSALKNSSAKMVNIGDVLYALYGATSGEVGLSKINGAINQAVLCIKFNYNNVFLFNFLKFKKEHIVSKYLQGGQGNLSADIIKNLKISLPTLPEQQKIADFLSAVDERINLVKQQLDKTKEFKKGLLQKMFV
jgi:type I restriction enzyme, S subunit